ncbi:MAG TPA: DNA polymerase III subunit chi [Steroidobacteraceae bacterium]|nr:DNA polymerase III subunit chi [Steroidobacteraceae bacterium]
MAAIDFYTLPEGSRTPRLKAVCQLVEKAFLGGERVLVWLQDDAQQASFDDLLWTFGDRAFVPHEPLAADPAASEAPVQLFAGASLPATAKSGGFSTLVSLREEASADALDFNRVVEVVDADPAIRNAGRARFRFYRERGVTPSHHELNEP